MLVFANGQNEAKISLTVVQDNNPEPSEMFSVNLSSNSVTGQAKVEGITSVQLLIEDSDNMYGTVEFGPGTENKLVTVSCLPLFYSVNCMLKTTSNNILNIEKCV